MRRTVIVANSVRMEAQLTDNVNKNIRNAILPRRGKEDRKVGIVKVWPRLRYTED